MKKNFLVFSLVLCFALFASVRSSQAQVACPNLDRSLHRGMDGDDVLELQQFLNAIGYDYFVPTGHFGPLTQEAVKDFQIKNGLRNRADTDEVVAGPRTREKIAAICDRSGTVKNAPANQTIRVLSPNGDEEITRRDFTLIRWQMDGSDGTVRLFLINVDGHRTWVIGDVYAKGGGAVGEYSWFVSGGDIDNQELLSQHALFNAGSNPCCGDHFKIQACVLAYALCDESDGKFTLKTMKAIVDVQAMWEEDGDGDLTDSDNHIIDEPTGAILIGKDVNFTASSTNDHGGTVRFLDVPFGYYVLSVRSEGYDPGVEHIVKINHFNAPRDPDVGGARHRYAPIILRRTNAVWPPITVKLPRPGEALIFNATTTIKWRSDRERFDIDLLSADNVVSWPIARGVTDKYFVWTVGHYLCLPGIVCPPLPLVPGGTDYRIRVTTGAGEFDGTGSLTSPLKTFKIFPASGTPTLSIKVIEPLGSERVGVEVWYDPDGDAGTPNEVNVTAFATWRSSNISMVDYIKRDARRFLVALGEGLARMSADYRGAKAAIDIQVGLENGNREKPIIHSITPVASYEVDSSGTNGTLPNQPDVLSNTFRVDDRIEVTGTSVVNVRHGPGTRAGIDGRQIRGARGYVIEGPLFADGYWWWGISYDSGVRGWSAENYLVKVGL